MKYLAVAAVALAALSAAGTATAATTRLDRQGTILLDGRRVFPIVLSKGPPAAGFVEVAAAGVNFVRVGPADTWNEDELAVAIADNRAAAAAGLHTWVNLSSLSVATPWSWQEEMLRYVVGSLERDPSAGAIGMWKGADEPAKYNIPPSWLQFSYCLGTGRGAQSWCATRRPIDRDHLWVTVQAPRGGVPRFARYGPVTDIHGINRYPIAIGDPDPDLDDVGHWTNALSWGTRNRAVWTTLQICWTWSYDAGGNFALPTFAQERFMAYDAIINGARALAFYGGNNPRCWGTSDAARGWNWSFWESALEPLVRELGAASRLAPALVSPGSTRWLPTSDPETQAIARRGRDGDLWVIAARGSSEPGAATIGRLPRWVKRADVYTEGRTVEPAAGVLADAFPPWGVHVYRFRRQG